MSEVTPNQMTPRELRFLRTLFVISALWNFAGAIPGLTDPNGIFFREFGHAIADPVLIAVYRGAWGTAFLYGVGFLIAAYSPQRHTGIILMGGLGKALFALNLLYMFMQGWTSAFAIVVILGDVLFVGAFAFYLFRVKLHGAVLA